MRVYNWKIRYRVKVTHFSLATIFSGGLRKFRERLIQYGKMCVDIWLMVVSSFPRLASKIKKENMGERFSRIPFVGAVVVMSIKRYPLLGPPIYLLASLCI